ncbi:MAG: hypothetical protein D6715_12485, partial [Calditrichaeota bacterium]
MKSIFRTGIYLLVLVPGILFAQAPRQLSYQGMLTDAEGNPVDGTRNMTFRIYDADVGGNELWEESHEMVV